MMKNRFYFGMSVLLLTSACFGTADDQEADTKTGQEASEGGGSEGGGSEGGGSEGGGSEGGGSEGGGSEGEETPATLVTDVVGCTLLATTSPSPEDSLDGVLIAANSTLAGEDICVLLAFQDTGADYDGLKFTGDDSDLKANGIGWVNGKCQSSTLEGLVVADKLRAIKTAKGSVMRAHASPNGGLDYSLDVTLTPLAEGLGPVRFKVDNVSTSRRCPRLRLGPDDGRVRDVQVARIPPGYNNPPDDADRGTRVVFEYTKAGEVYCGIQDSVHGSGHLLYVGKPKAGSDRCSVFENQLEDRQQYDSTAGELTIRGAFKRPHYKTAELEEYRIRTATLEVTITGTFDSSRRL